jgi:hypothetical protein
MSYTVLARKYRSSTFDEIVGQAHVAQTLKRAIESGHPFVHREDGPSAQGASGTCGRIVDNRPGRSPARPVSPRHQKHPSRQPQTISSM